MTKEQQRDWLIVAGKYAIAMTAIAALMGTVIVLTVAPMIAQERDARIKGDERIALRMLLQGRDRLDLIDYLTVPEGEARDRKLAAIREKWAREEADLIYSKPSN